MHDGLEQRRAGLLHGFLESERAGDFERDVRRIDVVIFAVVEDGAEIGHGESAEMAARSGFANAALDGGNPVLGNGAAENVVDEFDALVAFGRFEFYAADAELSVTTGLLLVFAFGVRFATNGFAVRNFRRLQR